MTDVLFIKTSSLGDVVHHMPAATDVRRHRPDVRLAWVVEESFAPLVRLHPAIADVIPVASRRWRHAIFSDATWREVLDTIRIIRAKDYDDIVDSQGLLRSALIARAARGRRHGYDRNSVREPLASVFYEARYAVSRALHAVERNRILTGLALGYTPQGLPDYGLDRKALAASGPRYAVLLHGTARQDKEWSEDRWIALGRELSNRLDLVLPWGNEREKERAHRIAAAVPRARVADRQPIDGAARLIAGAEFVIGVDTGLMHLAAATSVPLVAIFASSKPSLTGPVGSGPMQIVGSESGAPPVGTVLDALARVAP